jgi:hypothetical protein
MAVRRRAIVATGHDVFVTAGLYSLLHLDFTLTSVAALLTLAGYSVSDTVVVFDRIRENRRRYKRMPLKELINLSTNQTLTRTVLTSITTSLSIIPLLFGGPTLFDFTAAICSGSWWDVLVVYVATALDLSAGGYRGGSLRCSRPPPPGRLLMNKHAGIEAENGVNPGRRVAARCQSLTNDRVSLARSFPVSATGAWAS